MKSGKQWIGAALVLAAGAICGCQNTVNTVENAERHAANSSISNRRYVTDIFLQDRLLLRSVDAVTGASGNLTVQVVAINARTGVFSQFWSGLTGENPYNVDYKFVWLDQNGIVMDTPLSIWRTVTVYPGEPVYFKAIAPNAQCKDFILNVKESK